MEHGWLDNAEDELDQRERLSLRDLALALRSGGMSPGPPNIVRSIELYHEVSDHKLLDTISSFHLAVKVSAFLLCPTK